MEHIKEAVSRFYVEMERLNFGTKRIAATAVILSQIVKKHEEQGLNRVEPTMIQAYIEIVRERFSQDKIGRYYAQGHIYTAYKFLQFCATGKMDASRPKLPITPLSPYYDTVIEAYVDQAAKTEAQKKSRAWAPKRYANWLLLHGVQSFHEAVVQDLHQYLLEDMAKLKSKTVPTLRSELRRFCQWLFEKGYAGSCYESLFEFRVAMERKIKPAPLPDEVAQVLREVNRETAAGKRNYAIILLGVVMGLRGCDVSNLKLGDIDWRQGEIRITQSKTGKLLVLPLTQDVGEALQDYILNARPKSPLAHVFLRLIAPSLPFASGRSPGYIYINYRKRLGLPTIGGLHALRRALGRNLVTSGTPVTTVAQVLGHSDITNTKQYIALDTTHLKACALDFDGIAPLGWDA